MFAWMLYFWDRKISYEIFCMNYMYFIAYSVDYWYSIWPYILLYDIQQCWKYAGLEIKLNYRLSGVRVLNFKEFGVLNYFS